MAERTVKIKVVGDGGEAVVKQYRSMFAAIRAEATKTAEFLDKSFSSSLRGNNSNSVIRDAVKAQKDLLALKAAEERAEQQTIRTKQLALAAEREQIKLLRERLRLEGQTSKTSGIKPNSDAAFVRSFNAQSRAAQADAKRFQQSQITAEKELTRQIEREAKAQTSIKVSEARRANIEQIRQLKQFEAETRRQTQNTQAVFSKGFGASFFGNLGANAVGFFTTQIARLPSEVSAIIEKATQISADRSNALKGLSTVAVFKGIDERETASSVQSLRLVKAGIVDVAEASTGLKNLLATGFSLPEAIKLFEAFSDTAAFGKQSALDFGEAIRGATEGLKNGNSTLVDNAGLTKNLSVILEEQGKSQKDVMNITSDASVRQAALNGLLKEAAAQTGDADKLTQGYTGSVAGLDQAYKNLYAAGGDLITQSPQMIAANKIQAEQIQGLTKDLTAQGNETQKTAEQWINFYAQVKVGTISFASIIKNYFLSIYSGMAGATAGIFGIVTRGIEVTFDSIKHVIGTAYNFVVDGINKITDLAKSLPQAVAAPLGLAGLQSAPRIESRIDTSFDFSVSQKFFDGFNAALDASDRYAKATNASVGELNKALKDLDVYAATIKKDKENALRTQTIRAKVFDRDGKLVSSAGANSNTEKEKKGINYLADLQQLAIDSGFKPGSGFRKEVFNSGSLHGSYKALDVSVKANPGKTIDDYTRYIIAGIEKGYRAVDERVVGYFKGIKSTGANVHLEKGQGVKPSLFLPQSYYSVPVGYLKQLDEKRRSKGAGGYSNDDIEGFLSKQSETLTKEAREKNIKNAIETYKRAGLIPTGDLLNNFQAQMAEEAKKAGSVQPTKEDVQNLFGLNAGKNTTAFTGTNPSPSSDIISLPTLDDEFLANYKEQLGTVEAIRDVIFKTTNYQAVVGLEAGAAIAKQAQDLLNASIEYDAITRQNANTEFVEQRQQTSALQQINSLQQEYTALQDESVNLGNAELLELRQKTRLLQERNELIRLGQDLEAQISENGANDALKIQTAHLQDILDLRQRELDAVISINRSQLELADSQEFSANQVRARVLEHLASQKTLNYALGDGIISAFDKAANFLDKRLGKLGDIPILGDLLKFSNQSFLSNITTGLLDKILPPELSGLTDRLKSTGNPVVDAQNKTNDYLKSIDSKLGGVGSFGGFGGSSGGGQSGSAGGGILGGFANFVKRLFSGGNSAGNYRTPSFNPNSFAGGGSGGSSGGLSPAQIIGLATDGGGRGGLSTGQSIFGETLSGLGGGTQQGNFLQSLLGKGGIFGEKGFGNNTGTYGTIGAGAGLLGGLIGSSFGGSAIGRRVGGLLSGAGAGLSLGASLGSFIGPIGTGLGALIGAGIGGLIGLFTSGGQRKKDEKARTEYFNTAIAGLAQFDELITGVRTLRITPESALAQGTTLGANIRAQYLQQSSQIKDNKTRNIALGAVSEIDFKIGEKMIALNRVIDGANAAIDRKNRIIPEFAKGNFFGRDDQMLDMRRGYIAGGRLGVDRHLGLFADGEMILNRRHQQNIISAAGFDVLQVAGVPNYPRKFADGNFFASTVSPTVATVNNAAPTIVFNPNITVEIEGVTYSDQMKVYLRSDDGKRVQADVYKENKLNGRV